MIILVKIKEHQTFLFPCDTHVLPSKFMTYKSAHKKLLPSIILFVPPRIPTLPLWLQLCSQYLKEIPFLGCPSKCHIYGRFFSNTAVVGCSEKPLKEEKKKGLQGGVSSMFCTCINTLRQKGVACRPARQAVTLKPHVLKGSGIKSESLTGTVRGKGRAADRKKVVAVRTACFLHLTPVCT